MHDIWLTLKLLQVPSKSTPDLQGTAPHFTVEQVEKLWKPAVSVTAVHPVPLVSTVFLSSLS
jgi:hypothetical protein